MFLKHLKVRVGTLSLVWINWYWKRIKRANKQNCWLHIACQGWNKRQKNNKIICQAKFWSWELFCSFTMNHQQEQQKKVKIFCCTRLNIQLFLSRFFKNIFHLIFQRNGPWTTMTGSYRGDSTTQVTESSPSGSQSALLNSNRRLRQQWPKGKDFLFSSWAFVVGNNRF